MDGTSHCGRYALTAIAFVGSVFSPWYARAVARNEQPAARAHVALNVALYDRGRRVAWIFAEHDQRQRATSPDQLHLGPSTLSREGEALVLRFDERTTPFPRPGGRRLQGTVRVDVGAREQSAQALDVQGRHRWWPVAPRAPFEVDVPALGLRFGGDGYHDANAGDEPLARGFRSWTWGRFHLAGRTLVTYDAVLSDGSARGRTLVLGEPTDQHDEADARVELLRASAGATSWGIPLAAPCDRHRAPRLIHALEATPFYARGLVSTEVFGERAVGVVETLDLQRFSAPWVQALLPFRSRRSS